MLPKVNPRDKRNSPEETPRFLGFPPPGPATTPNSEAAERRARTALQPRDKQQSMTTGDTAGFTQDRAIKG